MSTFFSCNSSHADLLDDPNPILDQGCPRSAGGIEAARALCKALHIDFKLEPLDCDPFLHGYGKNCADAHITIGIWRLSLADIHGKILTIPFYITAGAGYLLVGNELLHRSNLLGPEHVLELPFPSERSKEPFHFATYHSALPPSSNPGYRSYLLVVPTNDSSVRSFFAAHKCALQSSQKNPVAGFPSETSFAKRLHGYSHLHLDDMIEICRRARSLTPSLRRHLTETFEKCTSCKSTGRTGISRKISFRKILSKFNDHIQMDFFFIPEVHKGPILHIVDVHSGYSCAVPVPDRDMERAALNLELHWINHHGCPNIISGDPEFFNEKFQRALKYFGIKHRPLPARRHNKLGVVERKNSVVRGIAQRLRKDSDYFATVRQQVPNNGSPTEILSRASFLANIILGSKLLSSFEMARGYSPAILGLPKSKVSEEMQAAQQEQQSRWALAKLRSGRNPTCLEPTDLPRGTPVYFFKRGDKKRSWRKAFVRSAEEHSVLLSCDPTHTGKPSRAAYEDIRLIPRNTLLQDLNQMDFVFPRSYEITSQDRDDAEHEVPAIAPASDVEQEHAADEDIAGLSPPGEDLFSDDENKPDADIAGFSPSEDVVEEAHLWQKHPSTASLLCNSRPYRTNEPALDFGRTQEAYNAGQCNLEAPTTSVDNAQKDIGETRVTQPTYPHFSLDSSEQFVLKEIREAIGDKPASESKLQFAPRWLIDKAIEKEKKAYIDNRAFEEVDIKTVPRDSNIISSHHFFVVKADGEKEKLKLKCRLVPHGNRDREKDSIRKDAATAQFAIIRLLLSFAAILQLSLATIDIQSAYLQSPNLTRTIFMRPPKGWTSSTGVLWRLLKPAYGLVESGRLWALEIESWMADNGLHQTRGLPQLFIRRNAANRVILIIAKVVDDLLIAGADADINSFHAEIDAKFKVGRVVRASRMMFNRLNIEQHADKSVSVDMEEFMDTIRPIDITRARRKQQEDKCTELEKKSFLALTGSLNFLGHGVLPQAAFVASHLQQLIGRLTVAHLVTANKALMEVKSLSPKILFRTPSLLASPTYLAFSDASQGKSSYGQTGFISGIHFTSESGPIFHPLDWLSAKQHRVSFSSIGAEIIAAATSADRSALMSQSISEVLGNARKLPLVLTVDSHGLYSTITTLHEGADYRLRPVIARLRDSFECGEISTMQWIPGKHNVADALTKRNTWMYRILNEALRTGTLSSDTLSKAERVVHSSRHS